MAILTRSRGTVRLRRAYGAGGPLVSAGRRAVGAVFPYMASAAASAGAAFSAYRKKSKTGTTGSIISNQHDQATRYRRKRMPRRRRRAWVSFTKKVRHVDLQMQPLQIYTKEGTTNLTAVANAGNVWSRMLGGTTVTDNDELQQIFFQQFNTASLAAIVSNRIFVKSICLDVQLTNNDTHTVIIDMYQLRCRKTFASASTLHSQYVNALAELGATPKGGTINSSSTALTLFDAPNFCEFWQVMSKREVMIGAGSTVSFQIRSPVNKMIEGKVLQSNLQAIPFYTRAMFFTWHGQPNNGGAAGAAQFNSTNLTVGYQTVVHYAVVPGTNAKEQGASA